MQVHKSKVLCLHLRTVFYQTQSSNEQIIFFDFVKQFCALHIVFYASRSKIKVCNVYLGMADQICGALDICPA